MADTSPAAVAAAAIESRKTSKQPVLSILKNKDKDAESGAIERITLSRYKPESLDSLCRKTKFTKREIQIMYRGFKQECPTGIVNEETFKHVYGQFFPQGDSTTYAHYVFKTLDKSNHGCVTFEEFLQCLSELIYGSVEDKLKWAFDLYDQDRDGKVSKSELVAMVTAVYDMMGAKTTPAIDQYSVDQHVEAILSQAGEPDDPDSISFGSFRTLCGRDQPPEATFDSFATDLRLRH